MTTNVSGGNPGFWRQYHSSKSCLGIRDQAKPSGPLRIVEAAQPTPGKGDAFSSCRLLYWNRECL